MRRASMTAIAFGTLLALLAPRAIAADWTTLAVPGAWKDHEPFAKYDGFAWYRALVDVPKEWASHDLELAFTQLNNSVEIFANGSKIGAAGVMPPDYRAAYNTTARYRIAANQFEAGKPILIAVRMYDKGGRGGFKVAPVLLRGSEAIRLEGPWQFRTGDDRAWATAPAAEPNPNVFSKVIAAPATSNEPAPLSPAESLANFEIPDDLQLEQVLAEPLIGQPLSLSFDERGRMWVVEYLQYPDPAGLEVVSRDKFWRVVYDKVPPPPPNHFKGLDRISIHEDKDGDGKFDKHSVFVDGLNIATAVARGRGGVWILNPPYLLFYPDRNNDDVPDSDPVVHLEGFGLEDTHSVANSLCWGPDGWLYAAQGSTVSGDIRRPGIDKKPVHSLGQLIWRYHPETRRYEIFAEGGGNAFGVEIDSQGRVFSGHNGGDTRGFHYVQGGYYQKGFGKHGPLSNPYTFGYFPAMKHHNVPRFTHTFVIYEANALPEKYRGRLFGVAPLLSHVVMSEVERDGSSFKTKDVGHPMTTKDSWFRPVDIKLGPDGALYVADFYESRIAHLNHHDGQIDKNSGRVYRLSARDAKPSRPADLSKLSSAELVQRLNDSNKWVRQTALRLLGDRRDQSVIATLKQVIEQQPGQHALEALWALNLSGGFDETIAIKTLEHSDPHVRLWTVRLLGDRNEVAPRIARKLAEMARSEPHVDVRSQLACSAKRWPASSAMPIVRGLMEHADDVNDIHMPLLEWWAIEAKAESDRDAVLALFEDSETWQTPMAEQHLAERVMRRYAASGTQADLAVCAKLLKLAPGPDHTKRLMKGFETALAGRPLPSLPHELAEALAQHAGKSVVLGLRQGRAEAVDEAVATIRNEKADKTQQLQYVQIIGEVKLPTAVPVLLDVVRSSNDDALRGGAINALQRYDQPEIAAVVIDSFSKFNEDLRAAALSLLASRAAWTQQLVQSVKNQKIPRDAISPDIVQKLILHRDEKVELLVREVFGEVKSSTPAELQAEITRLAAIVRAGPGSPAAGKKVYTSQCGKCHTLFGEGGQIGPELTTYQRDDLDNLLLHVVNPSVEIREGFENYLVATTDGRTVNGFLVDQDTRIVVLRSPEGQTISLPRDEIEEMKVIQSSIMPDGQLKQYDEQQIRDLFAYLRSSQPLND